MASVWDKLVLDTVWEKDGSTILLFHGDDLEAFFQRAKTWLHTGVVGEDYLMRFLIPEQAERLYLFIHNKKKNFNRACLFINFRNDADATLFKIALA